MVKCVVIECHKSERDENWQSFRLPKTQRLRQRWLDLVNIDFKKSKCDLDKSIRVCSRHFKESDMNYKMDQRGRKTKRRVLKPLALPTENLFRRKHLTDFKPRFDFSIKLTDLLDSDLSPVLSQDETIIIRHLSRFFDCLVHPNLSATLATDQK